MIAMPHGEDLRPPGLLHQRIVRRHRPIVLETKDLAEDGVRRLRILERRGAADGDVEQAVEAKRDVRAAGLDGIAGVELHDIREAGAGIAAAAKREGVLLLVKRLVIGEVDPLVVGKLRMHGQVEHARGARGAHGRQAGERPGIETGLPERQHLARGPDADQEIAIGQRQQAPGPLDAAREDGDLNLLLEGLIDLRLGRQREARAAWSGWPGLAKDYGAGEGHEHDGHGPPI